MDPHIVKRVIRKALARRPWAWSLLRQYVRYAPGSWVAPRINRHVDFYFARHPRRFTARATHGFLIAGETRDILQRYLFLYGVWEPNLTSWIASTLKRGDVLVDVGANIGYYSLLASGAVGPGGRVVSVEASHSIFKLLQFNLALNHAGNVRAVNRAAADVSGVLRLFRGPTYNLGASTTFQKPGYQDEGPIEAQPLHELLTHEDIERARIIKIDVEGAELAVVKGLLPLLAAGRHDLEIVTECGGGPRESPSAAESRAGIVEMLVKPGFNVYRIPNDYSPDAYMRQNRTSRPARVLNPERIVDECDLVFSRRNALEL
jgi:FkbM family methyltransferase